MTDPRPSPLVYDELASPHDMAADCRATTRRLDRRDRMARAVAAPVPSIDYADYPREVAKPQIRVGEAAQRIANALHLHLD